jgi:hypothetical protein
LVSITHKTIRIKIVGLKLSFLFFYLGAEIRGASVLHDFWI